MRQIFIVTLLCFIALSLVPNAWAQTPNTKDLTILRITPTGNDVDTARQIVLEFNRPVVPVGRMERTAEDVGITITPNVNCQWRWLNTSALSCNLSDKDALKPATKYTMIISPMIKAEDGGALKKEETHIFTTKRPEAVSINVITWDSPVMPRMSAIFNQPVTAKSVGQSLYFEDTESKTRVGVNVSPDPEDKRTFEQKNGEEARDTWLITPQSPLPKNAKITIGQKPGLNSLYGDETGLTEKIVRDIFTYPDFAFRGVRCTSLDGVDTSLEYPSKPDAQKCDPMRPINLVFTSPVLRSAVADHLMITPALGDGTTKPWGENRDWSRLSDQRMGSESEFMVSLPWGMKAATDFTVSVAAQKYSLWDKIVAFFKGEKLLPRTALKDEFGRPLEPFTFSFSTNHRKPNYELTYRDVVLEKGIDSDAPIFVNNLKDFSFTYDAITASGSYQGKTDSITLSDVQNIQYAVPAGVRSILKNQTGAMFGNLKTTPNVEKWDGAGRLFAQVTPFHVYAKLGHFKSSLWVTGLSDGKPVSNAKVTLYKGAFTNLRAPQVPIATAITNDFGLADFPGLEEIDPTLDTMRAWKDSDTRLFVRVDKDEDMAILPISSDYEVQLWNINSDIYAYSQNKYSHMKSWGMTAQGIYRAGDTMQYKIYLRGQDNDRLIAPPSGKYALQISDPAGKTVFETDATFNDFGTFAGEYTIPKSALVGWYSFKLTAKLPVKGVETTRDFYPLSVLVSDFTPAPFRVTTTLNGDAFKAGDKLDITASAALHSGGAYTDATVRSTITLLSRPFTPSTPVTKGFEFDSALENAEPRQTLQEIEEKLDESGEWKTSFALPEKDVAFGKLVVESAVKDDRGKTIANTTQADYAGVDRFVGLKPTDWVFTTQKPATIQTIVTDEKGVSVSGTPISIKIEKETVATAKVKGAGNAYLNDNTVEWSLTSECNVTSNMEAQDCAFTPDSAGTYRATATISDTKGRNHTTQSYLWVTGADYVQWNEGREYALTIIPESNSYKVGDTARYLIKNPYPDATALITVERLGVMDTFVQTLKGSAPVIEIPIKEHYVPGFYVSVVVTSPRVQSPPPELGQIDMGKPSMRVGYVRTDVPDPYKQITITAKPAQDVYRPGDTVRVDLQTSMRGDEAKPAELAVAVLDESVFDLITDGKKAFDPYDGFYDLEALDMANYSLLTRLMGRQKFEKKGANPGGDGGVDVSMRDNFKFVSYWNPSVPVHPDGTAFVEFTAPDNLTGWKVLSLATTADDQMGLGEGAFKVNQPTEIRPVMPNQVREGDEFMAGFSVMNRTDKDRTLQIRVTSSGDGAIKDANAFEKTITLAPYKRETVFVPIKANILPLNREAADGKISFDVTAGDAQDRDGLNHTLPVLKSRDVVTAATFGSMTDKTLTQNIAVPADIYPDTGDVGVTLSPTIIANLDGAFEYMRNYPYSCWEQKLTKALMALSYLDLKPYLNETTTWVGAESIAEDTISMAASFQAPSGGMAYFVGKDDYADPYLSAFTALSFEWLKARGFKIPPSVDQGLETYLMNILRNDAVPDYYSKPMVATVRAVILAAYKDGGKVNADDIIRLRGDVKTMSLFGKSHYMMAASKFSQTSHIARETLDMILAAGVESGGKLSFNQNLEGYFDRILTTDLRDNCAVLSAMMMSPDENVVGDKPSKLVRMITQSRGSRSHFENTQENIFCLKALQSYADKYESSAQGVTVTASLSQTPLGTAQFQSVKEPAVTLSKPIDNSDLGKTLTLDLSKNSDDRVYYTAQLRYADKNPKNSINAGMDVRREYSMKRNGKWQIVNSPLSLKRGDVVRVDLYLSLPTARNFVVVNDTLPGGFEPLNTDLATTSSNDAQDSLYDQITGSYWHTYENWMGYGVSRGGFYHREIKHDSVRYYADWLDAGNYHLTYSAQVIAGGTFAIPSAKAEEMYDPDIFGTTDKAVLNVHETP